MIEENALFKTQKFDCSEVFACRVEMRRVQCGVSGRERGAASDGDARRSRAQSRVIGSRDPRGPIFSLIYPHSLTKKIKGRVPQVFSHAICIVTIPTGVLSLVTDRGVFSDIFGVFCLHSCHHFTFTNVHPTVILIAHQVDIYQKAQK